MITPALIWCWFNSLALTELCSAVLPALMKPFLFAEDGEVAVKPPTWGDASGVRGAAWLWGRP